jgi:hypothetical protein
MKRQKCPYIIRDWILSNSLELKRIHFRSSEADRRLRYMPYTVENLYQRQWLTNDCRRWLKAAFGGGPVVVGNRGQKRW